MLFTHFFRKYILKIKHPNTIDVEVKMRGSAPRHFFSGESNRGFSIIETLVAITILIIVIAGSLTSVNKGFVVSTENRNQITASLLAQDAMEYVKNLKSLNIQTNAPSWLSGISNCVKSNPCVIDSMVTEGFGVSFCSSPSECHVYLNDIGYHQTIRDDSVLTPFNRLFYLETVGVEGERKAVVDVTWKASGVSYSEKLVNYIFNVAW